MTRIQLTLCCTILIHINFIVKVLSAQADVVPVDGDNQLLIVGDPRSDFFFVIHHNVSDSKLSYGILSLYTFPASRTQKASSKKPLSEGKVKINNMREGRGTSR